MSKNNIEEIKEKLLKGELKEEDLDETTKEEVVLSFKSDIEKMMDRVQEVRKENNEKRDRIIKIKEETEKIKKSGDKYKAQAEELEAEINEIVNVTNSYNEMINKYGNQE